MLGKDPPPAPPHSEMLNLAAGTWLEQLRTLGGVAGPRVSALLLCSLYTHYDTYLHVLVVTQSLPL